MPEPKKRPPLSVPDLTAERIQALRELLPEAFSEGRIDFEKLRAALGDILEDSPERYSFSWGQTGRHPPAANAYPRHLDSLPGGESF